MANVFVLESRNSEYWEEIMNRKKTGRAVFVAPKSRPMKKVIPMLAPIPPPSRIFLGHLSHFTLGRAFNVDVHGDRFGVLHSIWQKLP